MVSARIRLVRRRVAAFGLLCLAFSLWWGASIPWGLSPVHIVPFIAPGILLGLGWSWVTGINERDVWSWRTAARWAVIGGLLFPPLLVLYVPLEGDLHPERMLESFVRVAWMVLVAAAVAALFSWMWRLLQQARHPRRQPFDDSRGQ